MTKISHDLFGESADYARNFDVAKFLGLLSEAGLLASDVAAIRSEKYLWLWHAIRAVASVPRVLENLMQEYAWKVPKDASVPPLPLEEMRAAGRGLVGVFLVPCLPDDESGNSGPVATFIAGTHVCDSKFNAGHNRRFVRRKFVDRTQDMRYRAGADPMSYGCRWEVVCCPNADNPVMVSPAAPWIILQSRSIWKHVRCLVVPDLELDVSRDGMFSGNHVPVFYLRNGQVILEYCTR